MTTLQRQELPELEPKARPNRQAGGHVKWLAIDQSLLVAWWTQGAHVCYDVVKDGLPEDAEIVGCEFRDGGAWLLVESAAFDFIPNGFRVPNAPVPTAVRRGD